MGTYRKKPVVVKAVKWRDLGSENADVIPYQEYIEKSAKKIPTTYHVGDTRRNKEVTQETYFDSECGACGYKLSAHGWVGTFEGGHKVCPEDWIITGIMGEKYPCKPDIFDQTYEEVKE